VKLVVATFNADKLHELNPLLNLDGVTLVSLRDFPGAVSPEEDGATLADNAAIKARAARAFTGLPAIADDTGLEVDALGGRPGVHAARFAGPRATYADNVAKLLIELEGVPAAERGARFRTVCVACFGAGDEIVAEGVLEGRITEAPRGDQGFGYDPVFEVAGAGRTLAEMSMAEKNRLSHRALAARALARKLAERSSA
jgi:XTP/dITP diphosphohydrolase